VKKVEFLHQNPSEKNHIMMLLMNKIILPTNFLKKGKFIIFQ